MSAKELPVIDLRLAKGTTRGALVKQLREALTDVGFIYLAGVDGCDEGELLRLTHWFFSLPIETRMKISKKSFNPASDYEYRGYFPVIQGEVSHKEGFEVGAKLETQLSSPDKLEEKIFYEDNQWPVDPSGDTTFTDYFRTWMENYHQKMTEASLELLRLISEGFDAPTEFFTPLFTPDHLSTLRLIHYPPRPHPPESARVGEVVIQTGEHRDSVMLTLLTTFKQYPGLQVRWKDDSILDVPHRPGLLVVNIGMVLAAISGGKLKATSHRVIDCCGDRFSVPFFLEPRYHGNINIVLPGGTPTLTTDPEEEVPYGPWIFNKITRFAEYKDLIKRVAKDGTSM
ncbi:1-aminocyclopropane-1-carboxylate oxidase-like [Homarus americanus]|uniref:1-aminocyclopropane-1-carboxylate oxidase-like n=1 Tax=Homarus americanus TaxID=6706 RepID=UPI001C4619D8|nr:1-aminocyclopropane-1-carboxylate oxidase-like [Homarus americanus]